MNKIILMILLIYNLTNKVNFYNIDLNAEVIRSIPIKSKANSSIQSSNAFALYSLV